MRGGNILLQEEVLHVPGLSPRARGKRHGARLPAGVPGPIPACAGETRWRPSGQGPARAYPRVRGGNRTHSPPRWTQSGLSPRARGKHSHRASAPLCKRPIPACAGETSPSRREERRYWAYPRVRGGNRTHSPPRWTQSGLSPRARGKHSHRASAPLCKRPIPACAGETQPAFVPMAGMRAYPRVRGGNSFTMGRFGSRSGLSPRARGKRLRRGSQPHRPGPIPACAGETKATVEQLVAAQAYPRVRGGNPCELLIANCAEGLSPRARGKRHPPRAGGVDGGPIPACAGETLASGGTPSQGGAYPRVRGGNAIAVFPSALVRGLSPRARGKRGSGYTGDVQYGPIPACAGETRQRWHAGSRAQAYPRVRGGNALTRFTTSAP